MSFLSVEPNDLSSIRCLGSSTQLNSPAASPASKLEFFKADPAYLPKHDALAGLKYEDFTQPPASAVAVATVAASAIEQSERPELMIPPDTSDLIELIRPAEHVIEAVTKGIVIGIAKITRAFSIENKALFISEEVYNYLRSAGFNETKSKHAQDLASEIINLILKDEPDISLDDLRTESLDRIPECILGSIKDVTSCTYKAIRATIRTTITNTEADLSLVPPESGPEFVQ